MEKIVFVLYIHLENIPDIDITHPPHRLRFIADATTLPYIIGSCPEPNLSTDGR